VQNYATIFWATRLPQILTLLVESRADIILLQEVTLGTFAADFEPLFATYSSYST
jgi:mRNA deadenylase 3'-5' endonuclease subunit Ccr4